MIVGETSITIHSTLTLDALRDCLEGELPGTLATCSADGIPNVVYLSQMEYVDAHHLALSFQFFNTTRANVLANPQAVLLVMRPDSAAMFRLTLRYLRTETSGPLFERMKAKLAGIASHTGMSSVFKLKGSDIYRVDRIEQVANRPLDTTPATYSRLTALRSFAAEIERADELDELLECALDALRQLFDIRHSLVLLYDSDKAGLFTVASCGYRDSGIGSEISLGDGIIGVCAREHCPIRIGYATAEYRYSRAVRAATEAAGLDDQLEQEIPLPGLVESGSQLAIPISARGQLLGVLYVESSQSQRFNYDDEDALVTAAQLLGLSIELLRQHTESATERDERTNAMAEMPTSLPPMQVRHFAGNDSIFVGDDYLIKGVAGAIFRTFVSDYLTRGRSLFSNRELRVDPRLKLPALGDNLEARLILLTRRLQERDVGIRLEKCGRGQLRLHVERTLQLIEL